MPNPLIAFLFAVGVAAWIYSKTQRRTGGNTQNALIVAGLVGVLAFIAMLTLLNYLPN